jgi:tetratricopeptide (TPR) repeat protein
MKILSNLPFSWNGSFENLSFAGIDPTFEKRPVSIHEVIKHLPPGWWPDVFIMRTPLYLMVPYDVEQSPFITVCLFDDWFGGIDYLVDILRKFDYIFTDRTTMLLLNKEGFDNVDYWPCFGYDAKLFRRMPGEEKKYDVTFIGNLNGNVQTRRMPLLKRLSEIDARYSVKLLTDIWGDAYARILNQSRIVFNYSIKGEMNMRAFEAPACGALLFLEDTNLEVRNFFEPGKECVLYNKNNFEELLYRYLDNEDERSAIAEAGWKKSRQYSYTELFKSLLKTIERKNIVSGRNRSGALIYFKSTAHRDFVQISLAQYGLHKEATFERVSKMLPVIGADPAALNDCAVILLTLLDFAKSDFLQSESDAVTLQSLSLLGIAEKVLPGFITARYNSACIHFLNGNLDEAEKIFLQLFRSQTPDVFAQYCGLIYPFVYQLPFRSLWCTAFAEALPDRDACSQKRHALIRSFSAYYLGRISETRGDPSAAFEHFDRANVILPHQEFILSRIVSLNRYTPDRSVLETIFNDAMDQNPFDPALWKSRCAMLLAQKRPSEGVKFINTCLLIAERRNIASEKLVEELETMRLSFEAIRSS